MVAVQGIATAAEIVIFSVRRQHIVDVVVKAFEGKEGAVFISLGSMVKHYVQKYLDTVLVKDTDQVFQLITLPVILCAGSVAGVGGEEADCVISPVIV